LSWTHYRTLPHIENAKSSAWYQQQAILKRELEQERLKLQPQSMVNEKLIHCHRFPRKAGLPCRIHDLWQARSRVNLDEIKRMAFV